MRMSSHGLGGGGGEWEKHLDLWSSTPENPFPVQLRYLGNEW